MIGVQKHQLQTYWPLARPFIEQAITRTQFPETLEEVFRSLENGAYQLWVIGEPIHSAVITHIYTLGNHKIGSVAHIGGVLPLILENVDLLGEWFRSIGCTLYYLSGRKGWEKPLASHGFRLASVTLIKEL